MPVACTSGGIHGVPLRGWLQYERPCTTGSLASPNGSPTREVNTTLPGDLMGCLDVKLLTVALLHANDQWIGQSQHLATAGHHHRALFRWAAIHFALASRHNI